MRFDLATLARRIRNPRRLAIPIRDIAPPAMLASDLYRASYAPVVALWTARLPGIVAAYERSLSLMTTDAPGDVQAEIDAAADSFQRLFFELTAALRDWALRVETWHRGKWRGAVLSASGVDLGTLIGPADMRATLETTIAWNTDLIRDVSDQTRKRIGDRVFAGLTQRKPAREVAAEIREAVGLGRDRSQRIATDQLNKLTSALADERRREAGLSIWEWKHSGKRHPRREHVARDGNYYSDAPGDVGRVVDGKTVLAAPARDDRPGQQPYCGCRAQSVLTFD